MQVKLKDGTVGRVDCTESWLKEAKHLSEAKYGTFWITVYFTHGGNRKFNTDDLEPVIDPYADSLEHIRDPYDDVTLDDVRKADHMALLEEIFNR